MSDKEKLTKKELESCSGGLRTRRRSMDGGATGPDGTGGPSAGHTDETIEDGGTIVLGDAASPTKVQDVNGGLSGS